MERSEGAVRPTDFSTITRHQWLTLTDTQIGHILSVSPTTVARYRKRNNLPKAPRKQGAGRKPKVSAGRFRLHETDKQNAQRLGITRQRAWQIRQKLKPTEDWI